MNDGFPGLEQLAGALATGETTSTDLVRTALRAAEDAQPTLNAFRRICTDRALTEAAEADRRLAAGNAPRCSACRSPSRTTPTSPASPPPSAAPASSRPRSRTPRSSRLREGRRGHRRQDEHPGVRPVAVHRGPWRSAPPAIPWHPGHTPGGSSGGIAAAVAAGIVPAAARVGRRRLGPHPGRVDRPRRHQAAARPPVPVARQRAVQRHHHARPARPHGRRRRTAARRTAAGTGHFPCPPQRQRPAGCASGCRRASGVHRPPHPPRPRVLVAVSGGSRTSLTELGHEIVRSSRTTG